MSGTLYVSTQGSDANTCTRPAPCASLNRALHAAAAGASVLVAPGNYGAQAVGTDPSKNASSTPVVFIAQGQVRLANLSITSSAPQTLVGFDMPIFTIYGTSHVTILGGSVGPFQDDASKVIESDGFVADGVYFHDYTLTTPGTHMECLHAWGVTNFTVKRSKFFNCAIMDLFVSNFSGPDMNGVDVENNWFDKPGSHDPSGRSFGFFGLSIGSVGGRTANNVRIGYNSLTGGLDIGGNGASYANWTVIGNVGTYAQYGCFYGISPAVLSYRYNVWSAAKCGPSDRQASLGFVDVANFDLHLLPGSPAIDAGDPASFPPSDIDGQSRPRGAGPDAGSDET